MRHLGPALASFLLLSACTLDTDYFKDYRGVNLLGNYGLEAVDGSGKAKWNLALGSTTPFMTWQRIGDAANSAADNARDSAAGTPSVNGADPVYRLEIRNLIPNGDFEDSAASPEGGTSLSGSWTLDAHNGSGLAGSLSLTYSSTTPVTPGSNRAMVWAATQPGDQLRLPLSTLIPAVSPSAWTVGKYRVRFEAINKSTGTEIGVKLLGDTAGNSTGDIAKNKETWSIKTLNDDSTVNNTDSFPLSENFALVDASDVAAVRILAIGALSANQGTQAAILDNIRLLPDDLQNLAVKAQLGSLLSGVKPLLPGQKAGMYVFTIDVKDDPTAGTLNRFHPTVITFRLQASVKSGQRDLKTKFVRPSGGWSGWTTLTYSFGFDFVNSDSDLDASVGALTISLSPTVNFEGGEVDVGSILLSRPTLTYNP